MYVSGQQAGVRARVDARNAFACAAALNQPGALLARIAADPLEEAQHHGLRRSSHAATTEAEHGTNDKVVASFSDHRKIDRHDCVQKDLHWGQRQKRSVVRGGACGRESDSRKGADGSARRSRMPRALAFRASGGWRHFGADSPPSIAPGRILRLRSADRQCPLRRRGASHERRGGIALHYAMSGLRGR